MRPVNFDVAGAVAYVGSFLAAGNAVSEKLNAPVDVDVCKSAIFLSPSMPLI